MFDKNAKELIDNIRKSNLPVETKAQLIGLLKKERYDECAKLFIDLLKLGISILGLFNLK